MDEEAFRKYLRRKGKKPNVVERNISTVSAFRDYLVNIRNNNLDAVSTADICSYVEMIEKDKK